MRRQSDRRISKQVRVSAGNHLKLKVAAAKGRVTVRVLLDQIVELWLQQSKAIIKPAKSNE